MLKKIILISLIINLYAVAKTELKLLTPQINNAQTALLLLNGKNITKAKLTLMSEAKFNIDFQQNRFKKDSYYALIPISYYAQKKRHKIIVSYFEAGKKTFKGIHLNVLDGKYKSEVIKVSSKKVKPKSKKVQERTKREYKEAIDIYKSKSPSLYWDKKFIYPMSSKITSAFGTKRVYNNTLRSYHSGTDFKAGVGEPIVAVNDGVVRLTSDRFYAGNSVIVDHGHGIYSCYFHLSKINVQPNQKVKQNELLGLSGATGRVTGPHLHFSTRVHGIQVDPLQLLDILNLLKEN